ncbi:hypothetical protein NLN82_22605 [Citrobacter portucalensis]|uniref:hypothetical protein n=1 Tax=Citrobacter portucalensis TaxID=1639133 RepID=UPI00226B5826|nr:hypothetical protein [Citrobacter portucalensis]MCX9038819.1 hypothetical protein [Citrobacter portucalensis]
MPRATTIICGVLILLSCALGWQLREAWHRLGQQDEAIATLNRRLSQKDSQLMTLHFFSRLNDALQLQLQQEQTALRQAEAAHENRLNEVIFHDEDAARWTTAPLPAAVIRLQQRPDITGAAGYRAVLSESDTLHPASQRTGNQR